MNRLSIAPLSIAPLSFAIVLSFAALGACQKQEPPAETQRDVTKAEAQKKEDVAAAQADATKDRADAQREVAAEQAQGDPGGTADAQKDLAQTDADNLYKVTVERAEGDLKVANEKCDALPAAAQGACKDEAKSRYESLKAEAERVRDATKPK